MPAISLSKCVFTLLLLVGVQCFGNTPIGVNQPVAASGPDDEAAIRALENRFEAAFNAGDVDAIMKNYISDSSLVVFDVVPRKQYRGASSYRQDWMDFFMHFKGVPKISITDLGITVDGDLGFSYSFQHITGTDMHGLSVNRTVRVTDGYRKIGGKWLIVLEHISVPVDLTTQKAVLTTMQWYPKTLIYAGAYSFGTNAVRGSVGSIIVYPETDSTILFYFQSNRGAPSYNMGQLYGRLKITNGKGFYFSGSQDSVKSCQFSYAFKNNQVVLKTLDGKDNCGFGFGVYVDGVYKRYTRNVLTYFEDETGSRVYFKKTSPENWSAP